MYNFRGLIFEFSFLLIFLVVAILFIRTLQNTLLSISPENRQIKPPAVWRILIPIYNFYFVFVLVDGISDSIQAHLESGGEEVNSRPAHEIGRVWAVLFFVFYLLRIFELNPLDELALVATLVCFIIYWKSVSNYKKKIEQSPELFLDAEKEQMLSGDNPAT